MISVIKIADTLHLFYAWISF